MASILTNRTIVQIAGIDAAKFLQNLVTNDVSSEKPIYAMMLSSGGRFLFDMFIINIQGGFLLDISSTTKDIFLQKLIRRIQLNFTEQHFIGIIFFSDFF